MTDNPLGYEKIPKLLKSFAIPSITAALVGSLYNIVDQIFIGQGVGYLGNAATNVSYPFSTICLAISLLIGIGSASRFSLYLGNKEPEAAARAAGNGISLMVISGLAYLVIGETLLPQLLRLFGATTEVFPFAQQYASVTLVGMPFLIITNGMSNLIRADGSPRYSMTCMVIGAIANTILDPIFIFVFHWGIFGAALATILGQILSFVFAVRYLWHFKTVHFEKKNFQPNIKESLKTCSMGISQGTQPIIGFNYGAKQYPRVREAYLLAIKWNIIVSAVGFFLLQCFPQYIIFLFGDGDKLYFEFAVLFMRTYLFMVLVNGVQLLSSSFFTAIGKAMKGALLALTRQVFFLIPLLLLLPLRFGIMGVLFAGPIADFMAFMLSVILASRELRRQKAICDICD